MPSNLFSAGQIGTMTLPNRVIRSATQDPFGHRDGTCAPEQVALYRDIPAAGTGAIITAYSYISPEARSTGIQVGFATEEQRDCFKMLTGVTGVGPKAALSILSIMTPEKIALAASSGDHKAFTKAAGVGPKLAQRITLELKDKVGKGLAAGTGFSGNVAAPAPSSAPAQAVAALVSLGYAPSDAAAAVARVDETLSVQEIITIALRSLSRV